MRHSQQLMARLLNTVCSAVGLIISPYCPIRLLLAALPDSLYPLVMQHTSVFWMGEDKSESLQQHPRKLSKADVYLHALTFPHERNHKSRRFFLAFTCPLLGREKCEVTDLTLFNSSNLGFFFFSSRSMLQLLHWIPAFQRGCVAYRLLKASVLFKGS